MVMLYKKISKVPFTKCRLEFRARVVTDEDVLSEHNQDWRLNRMKQITDRRVYVRIANQIAKQTGKRKKWPLSRSKCKMRVYTKEVNGRNVPMGVDVYWAPSWRRLVDIQNSAEFAFCFFTRTRVKRDSLKEWGPGEGLDNFGILKFSDAKFIRVDKDNKTSKFVEFYQIKWEPTRIRRRDFDRFPALKDDLVQAYDKAMTEYKQIVRPGRKQEPRRARAGRSVGVVQFQAPIAPIGEGHANVEPLAQPAIRLIDLPPNERHLGLEDIEEHVEPVNQGEGNQNEEREKQFDLGIVEDDDDDDDDEPGRLIIDLPQEEDEQSDLEDQEPADIVINQGQFGFEMQQNEPRQNDPLLPVLAPKPISEARTDNPAVHEPEQTKKPIAVQLVQHSGPVVPVLALEPMIEANPVNPAVHEPEPIKQPIAVQLVQHSGPVVPVLALEPMIEANPVNPAVHEPEPIKQPIAVQLVQHSGPVVPVLALEPMIEANPVNPAVHEPEPIKQPIAVQLVQHSGPVVPVLALEPMIEANPVNPAVHEPEPIKQPIAVQLVQHSGPVVPVLALEPMIEANPVNPAVHEPEPIKQPIAVQLVQHSGPVVPVLALEPMIEANPVNPAVHEPEPIKQPIAVQLVQHSGPVVPVLALEPMIEANPVNPAVHEPEPIEPQVDDQLKHNAGPQVPVLALEPMIQANPVNPAVHEPEPIERQISVQLDHRPIDQFDIDDHEPGQLVIDWPQNQNQEEQFNIEKVVENEQEQVQGQQGLIIDAPQIQDPADPLGLQNIDFGDVDSAELVINRFRDVGLLDQVDLENRENGEQDPPGELVNDLPRVDDPEAQANSDKQDGMDQRAGQPQHEMAHEQIEPVSSVFEQIVQQDGQQQQVIAPEPMNELNPVNGPEQIGLPIEPQIGEQDAFDDYYEQMERQIEQRLAQLYDDNQDHACTSIYSNWAHYVPEPEEDPPYEYVAQLLRYWLEPNYGYILEFIVRERREPLTQVQRDNIILWHRLRD